MKFSVAIVSLLSLASFAAAFPLGSAFEFEDIAVRSEFDPELSVRELFNVREEEEIVGLVLKRARGSPSPPPSPVGRTGTCMASGMCKTSNGACTSPSCDKSPGSKGRSCSCHN